MMTHSLTRILIAAIITWGAPAAAGSAQEKGREQGASADRLQPIPPKQVGGVLGERLRLWRERRLWRVGEDPYLLDGFRSRPGSHPWQGEHVGKWLHAATLAWAATHDERLAYLLDDTVAELLAAQESNGYLGTYAPKKRFYDADDNSQKWSWDVWTHRYVLYGLLTYDRFRPNPAVVDACVRMGDLLIDSLGPGKRDITTIGTRHGLSSACLLESILMLYERTGEKRFLDFGRHIVDCIEGNGQLQVMRRMLAGEDVSVPGDGKAYQLMAVLLGYAKLGQDTGDERFLETAVKGWERIRAEHIYETGGPWSCKCDAAKNVECFAPVEFYHPTNCVETCSTTTWIQLCLSLWRITGESRYADEAERALLNHLIGAQSPNGNDWAYFTMPNQPYRGYKDQITCCASNGPRALEMYARCLVATSGDNLIINSYLPQTTPLEQVAGKGAALVIKGRYPLENSALLQLKAPAPIDAAVDFRLPAGAASMRVAADGRPLPLRKTPRGYLRIERTWRPGERIRVDFDFPLRAHFHKAADGIRWAAFTWGPLVLAQDEASQKDEPQVILRADALTEDARAWLEPIARSSPNAAPAWRIKSVRPIRLVPYYQAGASGDAVRTMFPIRVAGGAATSRGG